MISESELLIGPHNWQQHAVDLPIIDGLPRAKGLVPRNYDTHPLGYYSSVKPYTAVDMPEIPESEWSERIRDKIAAKSQLSDIRNRGNNGGQIPSRDQNGRGYCWMHSGVSCLLLLRAAANEAYEDLSAYGPACVIKKFRDEGGWGAQGLDWLFEKGCPTSKTWPQQGTKKEYDTPATWAEALLYRVVEGFVDLQAAQYDRALSRKQVVSCLLSNIPVVGDFNWWGHSVGMMDIVDGVSLFNQGFLRESTGKLITKTMFDIMFSMDDELGGFGTRIWNSWGDSWSDKGAGNLTGSKAWPDGATAPRAASIAA